MKKKKKILLVDDSNFFLEIEKDFFDRTDCDVLTANAGPEALKIIARNRPDIILMDLYMKTMKGDECCKIIKDDPETRAIPVIIVTHSVSPGDRDRCVAAGCNDYIVKPINKSTVLDKVHSFIGVEIRTHEKAPVSTVVTYAIENRPHKGYAYVISEDDIFVKGTPIPSEGAHLKIIFDIAGVRDGIEAECEVVWTTEGRDNLNAHISPGMVLKFTKIGDDDRKGIANYVELVNSIFSKS